MKTNQLPGAIVLEGHVQGLSNVRSLGELGVPVFVVDQNKCLAQHSKYCTSFFICPPFKSDEFTVFLIDLAKKESIQGWLLLASNDHIVEQLSKNREELSLYYKILVPNPYDLERIIDKRLLMQVARNCGVPIPKTFGVNDISESCSSRFPLLVKGSQGLSFYKKTHKKAIQVNDQEELTATLDKLKLVLSPSDYMVQELIESREEDRVISFTCFSEEGVIKAFWMGRKIREHPVQYGTATLAESIFEESIIPVATRLVQHLSYTGICEIEFLRDKRDNQYKLIEINPRTWLWVGLAKECGVDFAKIAYRYVNDLPQIYPTNYIIGKKWINRLTDLVFSINALLDKRISLKEYLSSLRGDKTYAIWSKQDPFPGLIFPFLSLYIARKRR